MTTAEKCENVGPWGCHSIPIPSGCVVTLPNMIRPIAIRNFNYPIEPVRIISLFVRSPGPHLDATPTTSRRNSGIHCIAYQRSSVSHRNSVSVRFCPPGEASHADMSRQDYKLRYSHRLEW